MSISTSYPRINDYTNKLPEGTKVTLLIKPFTNILSSPVDFLTTVKCIHDPVIIFILVLILTPFT